MIAQAYDQTVQQPTQPAYSKPEATFQTNQIPQGGSKYMLEVDEEAKEIIQSISPELRNSFVILAIKNLKNDSLYGTFFKIKELEEIQEEIKQTEALTTSNSLAGPNIRSMQTTNSPVVPMAQTPETENLNNAFSTW